MCRFLLAQSTTEIQPAPLLHSFASMTKKSKALDGDWQGDGWGVAWTDTQKKWQSYTSLLPVWKDTKKFAAIPLTTTFVVHARSASFPQHKGILAFNQPYLYGPYAFVFNGLIKGVSLPDIPGRIGAEKIWFLLKQQLQSKQPQEALASVRDLIIKHSREVIAVNIGLAVTDRIFFLNYFTRNPEYYQLHYYNQDDFRGICSEPLEWYTDTV